MAPVGGVAAFLCSRAEGQRPLRFHLRTAHLEPMRSLQAVIVRNSNALLFRGIAQVAASTATAITYDRWISGIWRRNRGSSDDRREPALVRAF